MPKPKAGKRVRATDAPLYTTKIIKAGALLSDAKTLLAHWDAACSTTDNLDRLRRENVFGKASRSRVEAILVVFRQRYLVEEDVTKALVALVTNSWPSGSMDRVLYFHAARADRLLHDAVTELLSPMQANGTTSVSPAGVQRSLKKWADGGRTASAWSDDTTLRVAQGLLSALRDFGVLQGAINKRIAPVYLPVEAFAYIAFYLKRHQPSGAKVLDDPCWKLFFLNREGVERFFFEANQRGLLDYQAVGTVTRLTFPAATLEEYAHVLAQRAH